MLDCSKRSKNAKNIATQIDISTEGYQKSHFVPTETLNGGVMLRIKNGINFKPRTDLQMFVPQALES